MEVRDFISADEAYDILSADPYGERIRVFGVYGGGKYEGQIGRPKQVADLPFFDSLWAVEVEAAIESLVSRA